MSADETVYLDCAGCGVTFGQPNDPGRKRRYHDDACKQRAYRQRSGKDGHEAKRARQEREQARREQEARKARERRAREAREQAHRAGADWTAPRSTDTAAQKRARATCRKLMDRASHRNTNEHEASACREKADAIREKHGL